jgi:hypothetical protein
MRDELSPARQGSSSTSSRRPVLEAGPARFVVGQLGPETSMRGVATYISSRTRRLVAWLDHAPQRVVLYRDFTPISNLYFRNAGRRRS